MDFWTTLLLDPIIIISALIIGTVGEFVKRLVRAQAGDHGWRGFFYVSLPAQPVILGALLGLIPFLPVPDVLHKEGFEVASRIGTYALAGIVCKVGYDSLISTGRRMLGQGDARAARQRATTAPAAPASDSEETKP